MRVLHTILDLLFPPRHHQRLIQDKKSDALLRYTCLRNISPYTYALFSYRTPIVQACIVEAKFFNNTHATNLLATALGYGLTKIQANSEECDEAVRLIPIPLSKERLKERGYNQVENILRQTHKDNPLCEIDTEILTRTKNTLPQTSLGRIARLDNMAGAFRVCTDPNPDYLYIVIDDVTTTGATLNAAIQTLREAGARRVLGLALAHQENGRTFDDMPAMTYSAETRRRD